MIDYKVDKAIDDFYDRIRDNFHDDASLMLFVGMKSLEFFLMNFDFILSSAYYNTIERIKKIKLPVRKKPVIEEIPNPEALVCENCPHRL